ncbi:MAG: PDZ domain-containing protein [Longimicrobiales bacterium]|nr:PDZ domain-containing protein [Longimicrobiales bacterium]
MNPRARSCLLCLLFVIPSLGPWSPVAAQDTRFLRQPAVSATQIVFHHADDLWTVARAGGEARRLTSALGSETDPAFSPDGRRIAFTGEYGGNQDVYVVQAEGGQPRRLTWHPGDDVVQGWTSEGDILFRSGRAGVPTRLWTFYAVSPDGGFPRSLPIHQAYQGEMSQDGAYLAYQEIGFWDPEWRNYRGGQAQPVRVVSLGTLELQTPSWEGERHLDPTWMDGVVYYMSERDWASNVWAYDPRTGEERQLTFHTDFDVKSLDAGHGVVVYEQAGYLHELDPGTGRTKALDISVRGDQNWARTRWEEVEGDRLENARLSPSGRRALFEHRGELFTVPVDEGSWRNISRSPGVADRHPVWSPQGERIAWFNDEGGEYALVIADQYGGELRRIALDEPSFYFAPAWSPDGSKLAFTDTHYRMLLLDVETGRVDHVDTDRYAHPQRTMNPVWSPDSRYVAYARRLDTQYRAIFVWDTQDDERLRLTDGMADAISPAWDASGAYLYFLASTDFALNTGWLDMTSYDRPVTRSLYLAILDDQGVSPFAPRSAEEEADARGSADGSPGTDPGRVRPQGQAAPGATAPVEIDLEGIGDRIVTAPGLPARDYTELLEGPEGHVFILENVPDRSGSTLHRYSVDEREASEYASGVFDVTVSADRSALLHRSGSRWSVTRTDRASVDGGRNERGAPADRDGGAAAASGGEGRLDVDGLRVRVDPPAEWGQMLRDGWRFMRDFLYVDNQHGAPWDDVWQWYSAWLPDVRHRSDFNHLLDMMSGEIAVGHSYVRGGDYPELTDPRTGLLGVDLSVVDGWYRIDSIYSGESWNPGLRGPLAHPGMDVEVGDWLVAVDGRPLQAPTNVYELLEGTEGRTIVVSVNDMPTMEGARQIVVEPVGNESQLRRWAWIEGNRRKVQEMSDDRLAYVYLPNTGQGGYSYFNRMYFAQQDKQGAVIDERNNGGGSAADYIVELMDRELTGYFNSRAGDRKPWTQPMAALWGPKVMIINERAGSGGDLMPYLFRFHEVGPLVGTRTWGGLVGTWDTPPLLDGGRFVAPRGGFFDVDGEWAVEGVGVAPDIEVMNTPRAVADGRDPQLEAAVAEALRLLETEAVELMPEPPPPVRYRRPGDPGGRD